MAVFLVIAMLAGMLVPMMSDYQAATAPLSLDLDRPELRPRP